MSFCALTGYIASGPVLSSMTIASKRSRFLISPGLDGSINMTRIRDAFANFEMEHRRTITRRTKFSRHSCGEAPARAGFLVFHHVQNSLALTQIVV
jgi:hypothetical protein